MLLGDLTEWRILESMEWIAPLNTTLSKLSTLHCIVLSINDAKDWIHVSEEVQRMPVLAKVFILSKKGRMSLIFIVIGFSAHRESIRSTASHG